MKKKLRTQVYLVELINNTDRADDEAKKVRAISERDARSLVDNKMNPLRWRVGDIVLFQGNNSKKDKAIAVHLRGICTGYL